MHPSALPLLMARVVADDVHLAAAADDLAVFADPFDARSNLHRKERSLRGRLPDRGGPIPQPGMMDLTRSESRRIQPGPNWVNIASRIGIPQVRNVMCRQNRKRSHLFRPSSGSGSALTMARRSVVQASQDSGALGRQGDRVLEVGTGAPILGLDGPAVIQGPDVFGSQRDH